MSDDQRQPVPPPPPGSEGARLFDAMVRWRALSTTSIVIGFAAGLAHLVFTGTTGSSSSQLARGLALVAVLGIGTAAFSALVGFRARNRFMAWYRTQQ